MKVHCKICDKQFNTYQSRLAVGKGQCCSTDCRAKLQATKVPWNKGLRGDPRSKGFFGQHTEATRLKIRQAKMGTPSWNKGLVGVMEAWNKGKKCPQLSGTKNPNWRGGITQPNQKARTSVEYKIWERGVKERDGFSCQACSDNRKRHLVAHHIRNFAERLDLRTTVANGVTLCRPCHKIFHHYYGKKNNNMYQAIQFVSSQAIV